MVGSSGDISPKVTAAALGAALASILWTLLHALGPQALSDLSPEAMTAVTSGTATVLAFALGYIVADPARVAAERAGEPRDVAEPVTR